jgi:uncharacterized repeat protein (TIGR01451 family)
MASLFVNPEIDYAPPITPNSIIVKKLSRPNGDLTEPTFQFTTEGLSPAEFMLAPGQEQLFTHLISGTYAITETVTDGWELTDVWCSDDSNPDAIHLADGEIIYCAFINTLHAPDLQLSKADGVVSVIPGQILTYTLTVSNVGTLSASGVTISDTLPAHTSFLEASDSGDYTQGVVTWPVFTLTSASSVSRTVVVQVADPLPVTVTTITNTASVSDDGSYGPDPTPDNNAASDVDLMIAAGPDLSIALVTAQAVVTPGQTLTYTLTVSNTGSLPASGVSIRDTLLASHSGSYAAGMVTWPLFTLAGGSSVSRTVTVRVDERLPAGVDAITWTATVADDGTSGRDPDPANNEAQHHSPAGDHHRERLTMIP